MKTDIYNIKNEIVGQVDLLEAIFAKKWNADLVHQVLAAQMSNRRQPWAHTKTRADVSGGGKKPWKQKHTGRARHGSIRSPIWKGGGVTFGPTNERNFEKKVNKKMLRAAIHAILSKKLSEGEIKIIDSLKLDKAKTKLVSQILKTLQVKNTLILPNRENKAIYRASANIQKVKSLDAQSLNVYDLLRYKNILLEKGAVELIK